MILLTWKGFKRMRTKLKKIVREEIDEGFRQNWAERGIVAGFGFDHLQALFDAVPCKVEWSGQACADTLHAGGWIREAEDADQAIDWLEDELGHLLGLEEETMVEAARGQPVSVSRAGPTTQG